MLTGTFVTVAGFVPIGFARSAAGEYTFSIFAVVALLAKPKTVKVGGPGRVRRSSRRPCPASVPSC